MSDFQCTVKNPVSVSGVSLHTGKLVTLTFKPAPENTGITFIRTDIGPEAIVEADASLVVETTRGTSIEKNGVRVGTVEHVLAALTGFGIDNAIIELNNPETPILDGSSRIYVEALNEAGKEQQQAVREYFEVKEPIRFYHQEKDCEIIALPSDHYRITCLIDYKSKILGHQYANMDSINQFAAEIAPCRTFVFLHELEVLLKRNLIKGGDLSNAIVFVDNPVSQEELDRLAVLFNKPSVEVRSDGILSNLELYFHNEPARHKLLDVVGDLSLAGMPIKGHIIASKPGHSSNVLFALELKKHIKSRQKQLSVPVYNPDTPPVYTIIDIMKMLPHRPPFLLVDKITEISDSHIVSVKNVTMNEAFFAGHFPNEPIMPGVLQLEAMAQTGGVFVLSQVENPENYSTYFLKIDQVKFKQKVVPGDTLIFKLNFISPFRRGICHMRGEAYVGNKLVVEAEMMAQVVKNP
ncbi:MAG TPA: bifunctional UDP-3-O-[3-hydroxymyristoyl] N-acetylglucosamine deacetylase/3-hydroxyacyl-ACP dehydratase [Bacteroidales bacterium]|nr:bifunctional UDP-3-O-[3-hydroxymyristoyl] N-acetylglucosamine deacetylase/3-hydroxyacyl-ACP dehydratase [Bacteroidales bacterium]